MLLTDLGICDPFRVGLVWPVFRGRSPRLLNYAPAGQTFNAMRINSAGGEHMTNPRRGFIE